MEVGPVRREPRRVALKVVFATLLAVTLVATSCCGATYLFFARPWVRPPAGESGKAGVVRIVVHSVEMTGSDTTRVRLSVQNLRPVWELDGEFYLDEFWLEDEGGTELNDDYEVMWGEGQQDYVPAGAFETYDVVFYGVAEEPKVLGYDAWETGGEEIRVTLPSVKRGSTRADVGDAGEAGRV